MFDLQNSLGRKAFAQYLIAQIDDYCAKAYDDGKRSHLGVSEIGHNCDYYLWLSFRWAFKESYIDFNGKDQKGRMMRLFNRGHLEEPRWWSWLRGIGFTITEANPITGEQIRVILESTHGHAGGSLDAEATHESFPNIIFLCESKTYSTKTYGYLLDQGVSKFRPKHWGQMCLYGYKRGIRYAIYLPINKNDDDISALEVVELDWELAQRLEAKAEQIVFAKQPPDKLSENPTYFDCKYCPAKPQCHESAPVLKNCRSCRHAEPREDAKWFCTLFNGEIPKEFIPQGCPSHFSVTG